MCRAHICTIVFAMGNRLLGKFIHVVGKESEENLIAYDHFDKDF